MCMSLQVRRVALQREDTFVVMASDGLWDVMSDSDAVAHAAKALEVGAKTAD